MLNRYNHRKITSTDLPFSSLLKYEKLFPLIPNILDLLHHQHLALNKFPYLHRHEIMNQYHQWFDRLRFVQDPSHLIPTSNLTLAISQYLHHEPITLWGSLSELEQDSFLLLRLIGYGVNFKKLPTNFFLNTPRYLHHWEMFVRLTHQHARSLASGYLMTYWIHALKTHTKTGTLNSKKQRFRATVLASLKSLERHPYWGNQVPYFAQLFQSRKTKLLNIESMPETILPKNDYIVDNLLGVAYLLLKRQSKKQFLSMMQQLYSKQTGIVICGLYLEEYLY
jgi:hypothetical protein